MLTRYHAQPVLDLIGKYEGRGDYNIVYGGIPKASRPRSLIDMTIGDVRAWQDRVVREGAKSSAAGKYQIIRKTLDAILEQTGMSRKRLFDEATQEEMAMHLLRGRGFIRYLDGLIDADSMAIALAKEWASMPVPADMRGASRQVRAGQSYYAGDGLNSAHATVAEVRSALAEARGRCRASAMTPLPRPTKSNPIAAFFAWLSRAFGSQPMLTAFRIIRALVALANAIAAQNPGDAPRWSLFLTNRSFIALAIAVALNIAALLGVPLVGWLDGIAPDALAGQVVEAITALLALWAFLERVVGKTRVIWNGAQAAKAVEEAQAPNTVQPDVLAEALKTAGVK